MIESCDVLRADVRFGRAARLRSRERLAALTPPARAAGRARGAYDEGAPSAGASSGPRLGPSPRIRSEIIFAVRRACPHDAHSHFARGALGATRHGGIVGIGTGTRPRGIETRASHRFSVSFHFGEPVAGRAMRDSTVDTGSPRRRASHKQQADRQVRPGQRQPSAPESEKSRSK